VFPDEATLPEQDQVGSAGTPTVPLGGAGGQSVVVEDAGAAGEGTPVAGAPANGGASAMGGAAMGGTGGTSNGGTPSGGTPSGGTPNGGTGGTPNGGTGGTSTCIHPQSSQIPVDADTWIEQAKSSATHGDDPQLFVVGGNAEERALLSFTVPAPPNGTALHHASLRLHLEGNADSSLAARRLAVCDLTRGFNEARATWTNYDKSGGAKWSIAGGDIGGELAAVMLARSTSNGSVTFDVTQALAAFSDNGAFSLPLIVLDKTSPARPAPAELAFTSAQGTAAQRPALLLEYCDR
jgi:hypothetical protein